MANNKQDGPPHFGVFRPLDSLKLIKYQILHELGQLADQERVLKERLRSVEHEIADENSKWENGNHKDDNIFGDGHE